MMRVQHEARRKSSVYSVKSHHSAPGEDFPPELEEATPKRLVLKLQKQQRTWGRKKAGKAGGDGEGEERFLRFAADCDIQTGEEVLRLEYGDPFPKVQLLFVNTEGEVDKGFDGVVTVQLSDGTRLHGTTTAQMKEVPLSSFRFSVRLSNFLSHLWSLLTCHIPPASLSF